MSFCNGIQLHDCLECFEDVYTPCENIVISETDLTEGATYYVHLFDKFDNVYSVGITIGANGSITLLAEDFPDRLFSGYGKIYFYLSTELNPGTADVPVTINAETLNCFVYE